jgi:uncharacterized membrane protein
MVKPAPVSYRHIAGVSLERLAALSDGIFAVAMTLLVLGLSVRANNALHPARPLWEPGALTSEHVVWDVLRRLAPHLLTYLMSFLTLGIFWVGQQTQLGQFRRSDRDLTWIHLAFLLGVSLMPFSTMLLADYITYRMAVAVYWLNIALLGAAVCRRTVRPASEAHQAGRHHRDDRGQRTADHRLPGAVRVRCRSGWSSPSGLAPYWRPSAELARNIIWP